MARGRATLDHPETAGRTLMGGRLYNPTTGQFTGTDPEPGGNSTAYAYPQNPVNFWDPSGDAAWSISVRWHRWTAGWYLRTHYAIGFGSIHMHFTRAETHKIAYCGAWAGTITAVIGAALAYTGIGAEAAIVGAVIAVLGLAAVVADEHHKRLGAIINFHVEHVYMTMGKRRVSRNYWSAGPVWCTWSLY